MRRHFIPFVVLAVTLSGSGVKGAEQPTSSHALRIAVYESETNAAEYHGIHQEPLRTWLRRNRYEFEVVGDAVASDPTALARFAMVAATSTYRVPDRACAGLAEYVTRGGYLLWIDGPAGCQHRELLKVLGVEAGCTYVSNEQAAFKMLEPAQFPCQGVADFAVSAAGNPAVKATGNTLATWSLAAASPATKRGDSGRVFPAIVVTSSGRGKAVLLNWIVWLSSPPQVRTLMANSVEYLLAESALRTEPWAVRAVLAPADVRQPSGISFPVRIVTRAPGQRRMVSLHVRLMDASGNIAGQGVEIGGPLQGKDSELAWVELPVTLPTEGLPDGSYRIVIEGNVDGTALRPQQVSILLNGQAAARLAAAEAERFKTLKPLFAGTHGDYDAEPRTTEGRVDIPRLFQQIEAAHLDMYDFLIWHARTDGEDFQVFLPEAQRRGLKVWITLTPPSEPPPPAPFGLDYVRWAEEIGRLSERYDNLIAWVIDDFWSSENRTLFTPDYIGRVVETLRRHNPRLAFLPTIYWSTIGDADFIKDYGSHLDGMVFPYADLESTDSLPEQLAAGRRWLGRNKLLLVNVYASGSSGTKERGPRTPEYLRGMLTISRQSSDGIRLYCLPKEKFDDDRFRVVAEMFKPWSDRAHQGRK